MHGGATPWRHPAPTQLSIVYGATCPRKLRQPSCSIPSYGYRIWTHGKGGEAIGARGRSSLPDLTTTCAATESLAKKSFARCLPRKSNDTLGTRASWLWHCLSRHRQGGGNLVSLSERLGQGLHGLDRERPRGLQPCESFFNIGPGRVLGQLPQPQPPAGPRLPRRARRRRPPRPPRG